MKKISTLSNKPFHRMCVTIGELPTSYMESMTYYEMLAWFCEYLQSTVIPAINNNAEAVEELQTLFTQLKDFVDNYFENLDVQDEINNKLDEMAESGELEQLLQQILHQVKSYDTVNEMIADESLNVGQKVYCIGQTNKLDGADAHFVITETEEEADGFTIVELANGKKAEMLYEKTVKIADFDNISMEVIQKLLNKSVHIECEAIPVTSTISITSNDVVIDGMNFEINAPNDNYGLLINGQGNKVTNCTFSGKCGNYLRVNGKHHVIDSNVFNGANGSTVSPLVCWGAKHIVISNNSFIDNSGFNVQTVMSENVTIQGNSFVNPHFIHSFTAIGGERTISFVSDVRPSRYGLKVNSNFLEGSSYTVAYNSDSKTVTITLNSALTRGDNVIFRCYHSLEMININSHSKDITISGNTLKGTGDSGIVIGSDYHEGVLNPSGTTSLDYPRKVTIENNTITDCAYAGVAFTHACNNCVVSGNIISNCGWITTGIFSTGIYLAGWQKGVTVCNNAIMNTSSDKDWNETENGITRYGVEVQPTNTTTTDLIENYNNKGRIKIFNNTYDGLETNLKLYPFSNTSMQCGIDFDPIDSISSGFMPITHTQSPPFGVGIAGGAFTEASDDASIKNLPYYYITFNQSGDRYFTFSWSPTKVTPNSKVKIKFLAKANSDKGARTHIIYNTSSASKTSSSGVYIDSEWKWYTTEFLLGSVTGNTIDYRIIPMGSNTIVRVGCISFEVERFN